MRGGTLVLGLALLLPLLSLPVGATSASDTSPAQLLWRAPILIDSDAAFTAANGVTGGSGTSADPYVIEGWAITAGQSAAVRVQNTTAAFELRNLTIQETSWGYDGIRLENLQDARIENVTIDAQCVAVSVYRSASVSVMRSNLTAMCYGVGIANSTQILVQWNEVSGITLVGSSDAQLFGNNVPPWSSHGVYITESERVNASSNLVRQAMNDGIHVEGGRDIALWGNLLRENYHGITLMGSIRVGLGRNTIFGNDVGIWMFNAINVTMRENNLGWSDRILMEGDNLSAFDSHVIGEDNKANSRPIVYLKDCPPGTTLDFHKRLFPAQVLVVNCSGVKVSNLSLYQAQEGLLLAYVQGGEVFGNVFDTLYYGVILDHSSQVVVHHNFFVDAPGRDYGSNLWNQPYPFGGNWWSDYRGKDECSGPAQDRCPDPDGIGDFPHPVEYWTDQAVDAYPLMWPWNRTGSPPNATFVVGPSQAVAGAAVSFNATGSEDPDHGPIQFRWDWEGDGIWDTWWSSAPQASHAYASAGTYTPRLLVRDKDGYWTVTSQTVTVAPSSVIDYAALVILLTIGVVVAALVAHRLRHEREGREAWRTPVELPPDEGFEGRDDLRKP